MKLYFWITEKAFHYVSENNLLIFALFKSEVPQPQGNIIFIFFHHFFAGILAILGGAGGQLVGGAILSRFDLSVTTMLHICYISPILCVFAGCAFLIYCKDAGRWRVRILGSNSCLKSLD